MREPALTDARRVAQEALALYADDPATREMISAYDRRLQGPLRIALAGMVKAGKSTLLNALLGEALAATDAGECTRVVTWYRRADSPSITLHPRQGPPRRLPFQRDNGRVVLELGATTAEEVDWIDVGWPSESLRSLILIDTPGIASLSTDVSARAHGFLTQRSGASAADAVIYLMRHLHSSDRGFLEAFRDVSVGASLTVNAVAVLSRADEVGSARIDSLVSAGQVARRYADDTELRSLVLDVVPVAGLLAEAARTLRETEFRALAEIAALERAARENLLVSADRFAWVAGVTSLSEHRRRDLLSRFGLFGIRLSAALIRGGANTSTALAEGLVEQSGLHALQALVRDHFRARADTLKVYGVLPGLEELMRERPRRGSDILLAEIERIFATTHSLRELAVLSRTRAGGYPLPAEQIAEAERIVGGAGGTMAVRVGLADGADAPAVRARAEELLARWRALAESPLTERTAVGLCHVVIRSLEQVAAETMRADSPRRSIGRLLPDDVVLPR
ncbi:dynamin family protein [Microbacterium timonense]|uniref:dynamin family protein n=1 Tax=Microbacterium timonense TaxID=2086576 RepID=UPI000D110ED0|nr:dynamin family protein [Microbacterium timonense]